MSIEKIVQIILNRYSSIENVNFDERTKGSLIAEIADKLKKRKDDIYLFYKNEWRSGNSALRVAVENAFHARNGNVEKENKDKGTDKSNHSSNKSDDCNQSSKDNELIKQDVLLENTTDFKTTNVSINNECNVESIHLCSENQLLEKNVSNELVTSVSNTDHFEKYIDTNKSEVTRNVNIVCEKEPDDFAMKFEVINGKYYKRKTIGADGNCFYRCLSYHMLHNQEFHRKYRNDIVNFVTENFEDEKSYLSSVHLVTNNINEKKNVVFDRFQTSDDYKNFMEKDGEYGTDYELGVFYRMHNQIMIHVYREMNEDELSTKKKKAKRFIVKKIINYVTTYKDLTDTTKPYSQLYLLFSGEQKAGHWEVLLPVENEESSKSVSEKEQIDNYEKNVKLSSSTSSSSDVCPKMSNTSDNDLHLKCVNTAAKINQKISKSITKHVNFEKDNTVYKNETIDPLKSCTPVPNQIPDVDETTYSEFFLNLISEQDEAKARDEDSTSRKRETKSTRKRKVDYRNKTSALQVISASKPKRTEFSEDLGSFNIPIMHYLTNDNNIHSGKLRNAIEYYFHLKTGCTCSLRFREIRENLSDVAVYAKCRRVHAQKYRFIVSNHKGCFKNMNADVHVASPQKITYFHKEYEPVPCKPLRGSERRAVVKEVKGKSVFEYQSEKIAGIDTEAFHDGHPQDLRSSDVIYKAISEDNCKDRLKCPSADAEDLVALWMQHCHLKDPFLRCVEFPLTAQMYTLADLDLLLGEARPRILHFDATGSIARKPMYIDCKRIFYYVAVAKVKQEILKVFQMITSEHDIASISNLLKNYNQFVLKNKNKNVSTFIDAIVVDNSWALIHSIVEEWNKMKIQKYLRILYRYSSRGIPPPNDLIIIKICYGHFKKTVSRTIETKFSRLKKQKSLIQECMSVICLSRRIEDIDDLFLHFCTIILYKDKEKAKESLAIFATKAKECAKKLKDLDELEIDIDEDDFDDICADNINGTIYRSSPFYQRYNKKLVNLKLQMEGESTYQDCEVESDYTDTESESSESDHSDQFNDNEHTSEKKKKSKSKFYAPKFIDHVLSKWMPYLPMWSSIDLDLVDENISRVSNAYVESTNRITKEIIFHGTSSKASIADRVRDLHRENRLTSARIDVDIHFKNSKNRNVKPKYPAVEDNPFVEDEWDSKNTQKRLPGHAKVGTLKSILKKLSDTRDKNENEVDANSQVESFHNSIQTSRKRKSSSNNTSATKRRKVAKSRVIKNNILKKKGPTKKRKRNSIESTTATRPLMLSKKRKLTEESDMGDDQVGIFTLESCEDRLTIEAEVPELQVEKIEKLSSEYVGDSSLKVDDNITRQVQENISLNDDANFIKDTVVDKCDNGLVKDSKYYLRSKSSLIIIGHYQTNRAIPNGIFLLTAKQYFTIDDERWFDGQVIDSYVASNIDKWEGSVTYIPTDETSTILGDFTQKRPHRGRIIFKATQPINDCLLMPYSRKKHWRLLIVNVNESELILMDPYGNTSDLARVTEAWLNFLDFCDDKSSFAKLKNREWTFKKINNCPYQPDTDFDNCGPYVIHYMECKGKNVKFDMNFNPLEHRRIIASTLLLKSNNMTDLCLFCEKKCENHFASCNVCQRKCHVECIWKSTVDSDNEEKELRKKRSAKPRVSKKMKSFTCKLCTRIS